MALVFIGSLLVLAAPVPACGAGALDACRGTLLSEVNEERSAAGLEPVTPHPVLEKIAQERAHEIATGGSVNPSMARLQTTTRRYYREGYDPHHWTESALIGHWGGEVFDQWREVHLRWYEEVREGDYEHVGIGVSNLDGRPVFTLVFGLTKRTMEWRLAEPLADFARVREELLREVNAQRRSEGLPALAPNPVLDAAAQGHAEDMLRRAYYDHENPEGVTVGSRLRDAGYGKPSLVTENIAKGLFSPTEVVHRWMASSDHRSSILDVGVTELGGGVAFGENDNGFEVIWVQVFASPSQVSRKKEKNRKE